MIEKKLESDYIKNRIIEFSKYNEEELKRHYSIAKFGMIVQSYPTSMEKDIYSNFSSLLKRKYPGLCDEDDINKILSSYGHIFSAKLERGYGNAIYIKNSADILVYSFLDELNEDIVHELVHKLGYLRFDESFYDMDLIYKESGAELVSNTVLDSPECRELILGDMWTRTVGVQPIYMIETALITQLNKMCGENLLEKSVIQGKNLIEPEIENLLGVKEHMYLLELIKEISRLEKSYWNNFKNDSKAKSIERKVKSRILEYQNNLLEIGFEKRFGEIKSPSEAENYLEKLMAFSDFRVKFKNEPDMFFSNFFEEKKQELEIRYEREYNIEDIQGTWFERYPAIKLNKNNEEKKINEKKIIDELAGEKKSLFSRLFRRNKNKKLPPPTAEPVTKPEKVPEYLYKADIDYSKVNKESSQIVLENNKDKEKDVE